jgi:hypothetical protein
MKQQQLFKTAPFYLDEEWTRITMAAYWEKRRKREAEQRAAFEAMPPRRVVLVSCGAQKAAERTEARNLYTSTLFRKARLFAEKYGDEWFILSGLHGLVKPEEKIGPYEFKLTQRRPAERDAWGDRIARQLRATVPRGSTIIIVAGKLYRENIEHKLIRFGFEVETPTEGKGLYELMRFLTEQTKTEEGKAV